MGSQAREWGQVVTPAAPHPREDERLAALHRLAILDTDAEEAYDEIVRLAARLAGTPIALVSLVDRERQWFKARHGIAAAETPRDQAFCAHAILDADQPLVVPDARADDRFADNPLVLQPPRIRFYAGVPLRSPDDRLPLGTLCVISDEAVELDDEQLDGLQALAHQVERLLALRRYAAELQERNRRLEEATKAKSRFLATMSHDIRTPMNGIIGSIELLDDLDLPAEAAEHLERIRACSGSLLHLINNILDLSKIEAGALELSDEPVDLREEIDAVLAVVASRAAEQNLILESRIDPALPAAIRADSARLHQILLNLVANAVKFTAQGSVVCEAAQVGSDRLRLAVTDTGPGLTATECQRILEPFVQVGTNSRVRSEGSGLGLSIVRSLAEAMDGRLEVSSTPGVGSTFAIEIPLRPAEMVPITTVAGLPVEYRGRRILVVDDDPVNRAVLRGLLTKLEVEVGEVASGAEALACDPAAYDLVLMDCQMPDMDGMEVTHRWRSREAGGRRLPIFALTADAFVDRRQACLDAGMDEVLAKPITLARLRQALQQAWALRG